MPTTDWERIPVPAPTRLQIKRPVGFGFRKNVSVPVNALAPPTHELSTALQMKMLLSATFNTAQAQFRSYYVEIYDLKSLIYISEYPSYLT